MRRRSLSQSPGRVFYGWWIVAIGCVQDAVKGGLFNTGFTLYFLPVLTELNLSRAATSLPFSLSRLEAALGAPFVGYLIDRFDVRVMLVAGTLLAGIGLILLSLTHSYLLFVLVFIGPLSFGFQAGFNQATLAVVAHWFRRKRGLAMAIVQTGQAIGGVLIFPLVALAVLKLGWRTAAVLSGLSVLLLLPLVLFIRRSPESMGLLPDGDRAVRASALGASAPLDEAREFTTREALRTPTFWLLAAFHGLRNVPYAGVTVHLVPLLVWKGLDEPTAAFYVGVTALATVVVRPLTGWLGDRRSKQVVGAVGVLLGAAGLVVLAYGDGAWWALLLFAVLFSFGDGVNSVTWALVGDYFGRSHFATIRGWISMFQSFASMPAAVYTGWVYDQTQSYTQALIAFVICYGAAALVLWLIPQPLRPAPREAAASPAVGVS
ncbi:MAG TPA: MFS transporter [Methylomirabilota bacterium]|nr:MFS transporter [Methylomirabilota bacterium]